jgi:transposase
MGRGGAEVVEAWVSLGDSQNPYTLFDVTAGRGQTFPQAFLAGSHGFVHADAYAGYNAVHDHVRHVGCWMHARRYYVEAEPSDPQAVEALAFIRTLYAVERKIKEEREKAGETSTDADVVRERQTRAGPILAQFSDWLESQHRLVTPKCLFGQAVEYHGISGRLWFATSTTRDFPSTMGRSNAPSVPSRWDAATGCTWAAMAG